jgi:exopolysaccharide biosynthesis operon protein EpsL
MLQTPTRLALALLLAGAYLHASAQSQDPLTFSAAYSVLTDSNLFRLPAGANAQALVGRADASEQIGITTLGVSFKTRQSLQQFEFSASAIDNQYQNFNYLSYTGTNFDAAWRWSFTPRLRGNLTATRKETLNSFADFTGFNQRNVRLDTGSALDAEYELDGPWRLVGGVSNARQANQAAQVAGSDYSNTSANAGVRYAFASGSAITLVTRTNQGSYLNAAIPSASLNDNAYTQQDQDLRLHWVFSGNSTADANLTYSARTHPNYGVRDYDGFNTGLSLNWLLSGKTSVSGGYQHTLGAYTTAASNYSQTDALTLSPVWQFSHKASLRLQSKYEQVQYMGSPTPAPTTARRDTNRELTLSLNWQPYDKLSFATSVGTLSRGSSQAGLDYDSSTLSVTAQLFY